MEWTKEKKMKCLADLRAGVLEAQKKGSWAYLCILITEYKYPKIYSYNNLSNVFPELYKIGEANRTTKNIQTALWEDNDYDSRLKVLSEVEQLLNETQKDINQNT